MISHTPNFITCFDVFLAVLGSKQPTMSFLLLRYVYRLWLPFSFIIVVTLPALGIPSLETVNRMDLRHFITASGAMFPTLRGSVKGTGWPAICGPWAATKGETGAFGDCQGLCGTTGDCKEVTRDVSSFLMIRSEAHDFNLG